MKMVIEYNSLKTELYSNGKMTMVKDWPSRCKEIKERLSIIETFLKLNKRK